MKIQERLKQATKKFQKWGGEESYKDVNPLGIASKTKMIDKYLPAQRKGGG